MSDQVNIREQRKIIFHILSNLCKIEPEIYFHPTTNIAKLIHHVIHEMDVITKAESDKVFLLSPDEIKDILNEKPVPPEILTN